MKKVLLLCASHNDWGLATSLKKMGHYVIATGTRINKDVQKNVDEYICADYSDKELILKISREKNIDAICQCCNDYGVYTAAYVAEKINLPGYDPYDTTLILHNKDRFKQFAKEIDLLTPISVTFTDREDAKKWMFHNDNYPLIVKPSDASAGNGITRVNNESDVDSAIDCAFSKTRNGHIVIEPYIEGTQHGFCTFLINKKVRAVCSNDEYSIMNPYRVEIDTFPSSTFDRSKKILIAEIEKIADKLNLCDGIFHVQYIFMNGKPYIIEAMRRVLGNMYHIPGNLLTNMDWDYWETRARIGMDLNDFPQNVEQKGFFAYKTILADKNGTIADIRVSDELKLHTVWQYDMWGPGYEITNHKSEPLGFLFLKFDSKNEMIDLLINNYGGVSVILKEDN